MHTMYMQVCKVLSVFIHLVSVPLVLAINPHTERPREPES